MVSTIKKIGKYSIIKKLGEGGMSSVYKAEHPNLKRNVIIKQLKNIDSNQAVERFEREARIMMDLRNDNIVQVHDYFKEKGLCYIVMEFVDGISLEELLEKERVLPLNIAMLISRELCKALKYAHDRGVIHRDIKPGNVIISRDGEVKLTDFGIATSREDSDEGLTKEGMTLGTPAYMSPEQLTSIKNIDKRSDIYSLGITIYEMLCGQKPFPGGFNPETITAIQNGIYKSPSKINPAVNRPVSRLIKKAIHCKSDKRFNDLAFMILKISRQVKNYYEKEKIQRAICSYIWNRGETEEIEDNSKGKFKIPLKFKLALSSLIVLTGTIGGVFLLNENLYSEIFESHEKGKLRVAIKINRYEMKKDPEDIYIKARLYQVIKGKKRRVKNIDFSFQLDKTSENNNQKRNKRGKSKKQRSKKSRYYTMSSKSLLFPKGNYIIDVRIENEKYRKNFYLEPMVLQKNRKATVAGELINFRLRTGMAQPLKLYYSVSDINSRKSIKKDTDLYIKYYGWKKFDDFISDEKTKKKFLSGRWYRFKFANKKYYNKVYRLYVDSSQNVVNIDAGLTPLPGKVLIKSNHKGLKVLLNNSSYYFHGGYNRRYTKLKRTIKRKAQTLYLAPGDYFFTVKESDELTKTLKFKIDSSEVIRVNNQYDSKRNLLSLSIVK